MAGQKKRTPPVQSTNLMTAFSVRPADSAKRTAVEPLDSRFVARAKASLADPRPNKPAAGVRGQLQARYESDLKRDS